MYIMAAHSNIMLKLIFYSIVFVTILPNILAKLEVVNDEELLSLIRTEKYVIVLFSKFKYRENIRTSALSTFHFSQKGLRGMRQL